MPSGAFDDHLWQRFDPMPKAPVVEAAPVEYQFRVVVHWKKLPGKPGDYVVRRTTDLTDMWIRDKTIFAANCL